MITAGDYVMILEEKAADFPFFDNGPLKVFAINQSKTSVAIPHEKGYKVFSREEFQYWRNNFRDRYSDDIELFLGKNFAWVSTCYLHKVNIHDVNIILPDNSSIIKKMYPRLNDLILLNGKQYIIEEISGDNKIIWVEVWRNK